MLILTLPGGGLLFYVSFLLLRLHYLLPTSRREAGLSATSQAIPGTQAAAPLTRVLDHWPGGGGKAGSGKAAVPRTGPGVLSNTVSSQFFKIFVNWIGEKKDIFLL